MADYTTYRLRIMATDHMVFEGDAVSLVLPTTEGSIGILAHHSNLIMAIVPGILKYSAPEADEAEGSEGRKAGRAGEPVWHEIVVSDGLLKVENGEVVVLVGTAEKPEDIDEARARRAAEKAAEQLKRTNSNRDHAMAEAELSRALSRIKASKNRHNL